MAPSPENYQPWEFVIIRDPAVRLKLTEIKVESRKEILRRWFPELSESEISGRASRNRTAMETASWLVAVCYKNRDSPDEMGDLKLSMSSVAAWMCIGYIWLSATAEGLGLSPAFFPHAVYPEAKRILGLPEGYELAAVLRIGFPAKKPLGRKKTVGPIESKLHYDRLGKKRN